jgi:hypothetical protein
LNARSRGLLTCSSMSSPAGEVLFYIQQPGSPLCPQQLFRRTILRKVFLTTYETFFQNGMGFFRFSTTAFALGRCSAHMLKLLSTYPPPESRSESGGPGISRHYNKSGHLNRGPEVVSSSDASSRQAPEELFRAGPALSP